MVLSGETYGVQCVVLRDLQCGVLSGEAFRVWCVE